MKIGCHLSSSGGFLAMAVSAVSIGANVFQFFTRNPRGGAAKPIDAGDVDAFKDYAASHGIGPVLAHASYTLNVASDKPSTRDFAEAVFVDDLKRLEAIPGALYNFHPGSHVGQGLERGKELVAGALTRVFSKAPSAPWRTTVLLETMAGKGSEIGGTFDDIAEVITRVERTLGAEDLLGVCLDTCHVFDAGYDIVNDLDGVVRAFDRVIGLKRLKAIHLNDSLNTLASHKDRHARLGKGGLGLDAIRRIVNHPSLRTLPFYLETPCDLQGYKEEIALVKSLRDDA